MAVAIKGRGQNDVSHSLERNIAYFEALLFRILREYRPELANSLQKLMELVVEARISQSEGSFETVEHFISGLSVLDAEELTRALTTFFHLANLCEEHYRVGQLRFHEGEKRDAQLVNVLGDAYAQVVKEIGSEKAQQQLKKLRFHPVLTAHPTEARRRATNGKIRRIAKLLEQHELLDGVSKLENERIILNEVDALFRTYPIGLKKPTPLEESDSITSIVEQTIADSVIRTFRRFDDYLQFNNGKEFVGHNHPLVQPFFELGSWIGSDRDGNPNVVATTTSQVAQKFSTFIIKRHATTALHVGRNLTLESMTTPPSEELTHLQQQLRLLDAKVAGDVESISKKEPHRAVLITISKRLEATAERNFDYGYSTPEKLLKELLIVQNSLAKANALRSAYGPLQMLIWEVQVFGFHLASMEIRQHSQVHRQALADIKEHGVNSEDLQTQTVEVLDTFRTIASIQQRYGVNACHRYIISFTQEVEHIHDVFKLIELAIPEVENRPILDIIPLFETMDDLNNAVDILDGIIKVEQMVQHYQTNGRKQEVMLGYSDSSKDVGPVAATFALHQAQEQIALWAKQNQIELVLFHGRGGALGRGGGPAHRAVLAQPPGSVESVFKLTEQGETIMARYGNTELGIRHIETVAAATFLNSLPSVEESNRAMVRKYAELVEKLTEFSRRKFHQLIQCDDFANWFAVVTPLEELGLMPIGSRPAKRGLLSRSLEDLRAIPWVFAWSQARINLAAWYGFGSACQEFIETFTDPEIGVALLQQAYKEWNLLTTLVDNIEMSIAKTDERIAALYLSLSNRTDLKEQVLNELKLTSTWITKINQIDYPLAHKKVLGQAIQIRGPYIDALSMLQFVTLRALRQKQDSFTPEEIEKMKYLLLCTVSGISAGLQNTG